MSENVSVIAVFNTVGELKPLWINKDGKKSKITAINSIMDIKGIRFFNCVCNGQIIVLCLDIENHIWTIG